MRKIRRILSLVLVLSLALVFSLNITAMAADDRITVTVPDGAGHKDVIFNEDTGYPYIDENGRVMVPLRASANALGLMIQWDSATQTAHFMTTTLGVFPLVTASFTVGSNSYTITANGETKSMKMDTVTAAKDGRIYAPVRYLAEAFDYKVRWDGSKRNVSIEYNWDEQTAKNMGLFFSAMEDAKYIVNRPKAYEPASFNAYFDLFELNYWSTLSSRGTVSDDNMWQVYALLEAREKLVQTAKDPENTIWYIWGKDMPTAAGSENYNYSYSYDRADFKPFLIPYLLTDQSQVKGNVIVIAGGGFALRSNSYEGYAIAERFNEMGYNAFVLQRRVTPYMQVDASLDLQRAIRYIRYNSENYNIAKTDKIACCGFSGGSMTINATIQDLYGDILPTTVYPDYKCDEVDRVNSDMQSALLMYGAAPLNTKNPNLPDVFMAIGSNDGTADPHTHLEAIDYYLSKGVRCEAIFFAGIDHGFGGEWGFDSKTFTTYESPVSSVWPEMADTFLSVQWGDADLFTEHGR